jgi:dienelactone hydrolase
MPDRRAFVQGTASAFAAQAFSGAAESANSATPEVTVTLRDRLLTCLGGPWPDPVPRRVDTAKSTQHDGYRIEHLSYAVSADERVPALLLIPDGVSATSPAPAVAVWHQHNGQYHLGKSEPAGLAGDPMQHTGVALAKEGYVVLCPDALCFEDRQDPTGKLKGGQYERFEFLRELVAGRSMAWQNIRDMRVAIDYLASRTEVDAARMGCYGHSMGSTHTWLIGPWEPRLKALVGNCCLPTYGAIHRTHILHCFPNFIPGFHAFGDTPDVAALIAPRRLHLNFGETDGGSPIAEVRSGISQIAEAYAKAGAASAFSSFIQPDTGHELSPAMWTRVRETFTQAFA